MHIYELINLVGVDNAGHGLEQLMRLWSKYRTHYPQLDHHLPDWIVDYAIVNRVSTNPLALYAAVPPTFAYARQYADFLLPTYLEQGVQSLPLSLNDALVDHKIEKSKFYTPMRHKLLEEKLRAVLQAVNIKLLDTELLETESPNTQSPDTTSPHTQSPGAGGIFQRYGPEQTTRVAREPFEDLIYYAVLAPTPPSTWPLSTNMHPTSRCDPT